MLDKKSLQGILLILVLIVGWSIYMANQQEESPQQAHPNPVAGTDTLQGGGTAEGARPAALADTGQSVASAAPADTLPDSVRKAAELADAFGTFAPAASGTEKTLTVETDVAYFTLSTKGGRLISVILKNYKTHDGEPLPVLANDSDNYFGYQFRSRGRLIDTRKLFFQPTENEGFTVSGGQSKTLALRAALGNGKYLEQRYTFKGDAYDVAYRLVVSELGNEITDNFLMLEMRQDLPQTERSWENMMAKATIFYQTYAPDASNGDVGSLTEQSSEIETETVGSTGWKWVAFKNQFFSTIIVAQDKFHNGSGSSTPTAPGDAVKRLDATLGLAYSHRPADSVGLTMLFVPNSVDLLNEYNLRLSKIVDLGWGPIRWINTFILWVFHALEGITSNYGIIILILAVLVKVLLWPLTHRSFTSQAKMTVVNKMPEVEEINNQHKDDPAKLQQAKMAFYTQVGVSPLGGCLPLLLQFPILIAMFMFFPNSIELRQEPFLWATDLSTYDSVWDFGFHVPLYGDHVSLFTLLWVISQLATAWIQQLSQGPLQAGQPKLMRYLPYLMPVMFLGIFNNYSSGLSYYYLLYNLLTLAQTQALKAFFVDEEKIRQEIQDYRSGKVKRKSGGIMGWMQRQQAQRQEMMEERYAQAQGRQGRRALEQQRQKQQRQNRSSNPPKKRK